MTRAIRPTILLLMAIVFLFAAEFAILRAFRNDKPIVMTALTTFPMVDFLLLALPKVWPDRPSRPFWRGFEAVGWTTVLVFPLLLRSHGEILFAPITLMQKHTSAQLEGTSGLVVLISILVLYTVGIQWLLAAIGGW